jgi:hypothetical protein
VTSTTAPQTIRPLGQRQLQCLKALARHGAFPGGWYFGTQSATLTILDSLVKRGLVHREERFRTVGAGRFERQVPFGYYTLTAAGREVA